MTIGPLSVLSEVVDERRRWNPEWYSWLADLSTPLVVGAGALPNAAQTGVGARAFVKDANSTTFGSIVAGGGSNTVPVYSDGTNWRIG